MSLEVLITSTSFGKMVKEPVELLNNQSCEIIWNKLGRSLGKAVTRRARGFTMKVIYRDCR